MTKFVGGLVGEEERRGVHFDIMERIKDNGYR